MSENVPTAAIVTIGDEVLRGDTVDTNKAYLGTELTRRGVQVAISLSIPDEMDTIVYWIKKLSSEHDYVLSCGGIGATPDDLTREAMALAFDLPMIYLEEEIAEAQRKISRPMNDGMRESWHLPLGSELLFGEGVIAPGFRIRNVYAFPGVPKVMHAMWEWVSDRFIGIPVHCYRFKSFARESLFRTVMGEYIERFPQIQFGSYPKLDENNKWSVEIALHGTDKNLLEQVGVEFKAAIEKASGVQ